PVRVPPLRADRLPARSAALLRRPRRAVSVGLRLRPRGRLRSLDPRRRPDVSTLPLVLPPQGTPPRLAARLHLMIFARGRRGAVDAIAPSEARERRTRCNTLKPFVGTLRVESPSSSV